MATIDKIFDFTTPGDYTYNSSLITVSNGAALSADQTPEHFLQNFTSSSGFTYNPSLAEFTGTVLRQKNQVPTGATLGAQFSSTTSANWGNGSLTPLFSTTTISGGKLDLTGATNKTLELSAVGNADSAQTGCVRFQLTPQYSGNPAAIQSFFNIVGPAQGTQNLVRLYQNTSGLLTFEVWGNTGGTIVAISASFSFVSGQTYEIECNYDITTGASRLFIDGVQLGSTGVGTGTRVQSNITQIWLGSQYNSAFFTDVYMSNFEVFNAVQHTANYTPGYSIPSSAYLASTVVLPAFAGLGVIAYTNLFTTQSSGTQFIIDGQYWNGSAWTTSDGSYAQSNTLAVVNVNLATKSVSDTPIISVTFPNTNVQNSISALDLTYIPLHYSTSNPSIKNTLVLYTSGITSFSSSVTTNDGNIVLFTIEVNGIEKYWTGTAWATSSGPTQANTGNDITAHISTLISSPVQARFVAYLKSNNGTMTPELNSVEIIYNEAFVNPDVIQVTGIWAYSLLATDGSPDLTPITVQLYPTTTKYKTSTTINSELFTVTPDPDGYWEVRLVDNTNMAAGSQYIFTINGERYVKTVPVAASINFYSL